MASYSIVLNLSGNAVTKAERLAAVLATANTNAAALAANLRSVGVAASSIPKTPIIVRRGSAARVVRGTTAAGPSADRGMYRNHPGYTRHRYNRVASFGYGFSIGGFSGRLSSILQPDANGRMFGLDAGTLAKSLNIAGIATNVLSSIGRGLWRATKISTLAPIVGAAVPMAFMTKTLMSEGFASGVRLISRRHQARMGLGADYEQGQSNADYLAGSYGLDRATSLSSINVLSGLGVGGTDQRITLNEATGLTKVGGLISQHAGVPFERVMTNIQQLLVQAAPNIRDIRELLNQAPVLGKYALREMDKRGITGVDVRTYLKDQSNLLSVLKSYELDNASNLGMQARGEIMLAMQDFWASIAGNKSWGWVGGASSQIINSAAMGLNTVLTTLTQNENFQTWVENLALTFENLAKNGDSLVDKLVDWTEKITSFLGIDFGDTPTARVNVGRENTIKNALEQPGVRDELFRAAQALGVFRTKTEEDQRKEFDEIYARYGVQAARDKDLRESVVTIGDVTNYNDLPFKVRALDAVMRGPMKGGLARGNEQAYREFLENAHSAPGPLYVPKGARELSEGNIGASPGIPFFGASVSTAVLRKNFETFLETMTKVGTFDPERFKLAGAPSGDDLTGFNRDRRSLEIHFHDKLVEWNSEIVTNNPIEVADYVADNMDQIISAAIQRAMLGATTTIGRRF